MTRKNVDNDDFSSAGEVLSRKQVLDALRRNASLADQDMRGSDLVGICFDNADLQRAKLADANLSRSSFRNANLAGASLWHANLKDAVLDGANLEHADFDFANLDGVTLKGAKIKKTIFPHGRLTHDAVVAAVKTGDRLRIDGVHSVDE